MADNSVLYCTDFSENSLPARQKAIEYAAAFRAELLILHVVGASHFGYPSLEGALAEEMTRIHQKIDERVREAMKREAGACKRYLNEVTTYLRSGETAVEIVRFAAKQRVHLIVMGTHGWSGVKRILGSTASNVVRTATCPVMVVRTHTEA